MILGTCAQKLSLTNTNTVDLKHTHVALVVNCGASLRNHLLKSI